MPGENPIADVAHVIQLSVAPVFLLTAIGTVLSVLSTRLGRIVDRSRVLAERSHGAAGEALTLIEEELGLLLRRRHLVNIAITCGTSAALMVASVIGSAFLGFLLGWKVAGAVAVLFILAMLFVVAALLLFLREVFIAATSVTVAHLGASGPRTPARPGGS
jgi:hypothetical protein